MSKKAIISKHFLNLQRVLEISKIGGFRIGCVANSSIMETNPEKFTDIVDYFGFEIANTEDMNNYDMILEIHNYPFESGEYLIEKSPDYKDYDLESEELDISSLSLLRMSFDKLNMSITDTDKIKKISTVIAKMDKSKRIQVQHVAEAITYVAGCKDKDEHKYISIRKTEYDNLLNQIKMYK